MTMSLEEQLKEEIIRLREIMMTMFLLHLVNKTKSIG